MIVYSTFLQYKLNYIDCCEQILIRGTCLKKKKEKEKKKNFA